MPENVEDVQRLNPSEEAKARLSIAEYMLKSACEELEKGDQVQVSEKLYKTAEECIKILACLREPEECGIARR